MKWSDIFMPSNTPDSKLVPKLDHIWSIAVDKPCGLCLVTCDIWGMNEYDHIKSNSCTENALLAKPQILKSPAKITFSEFNENLQILTLTFLKTRS